MLLLRKTTRHPQQSRPLLATGKCALLTLLLLWAPACFSIQAENVCYYMDALELKTSEDMDTESITIGVRYASTFEIPVTQEVVDAIEATDKWNPELSLKSIRIISPSDTKYSLTEIDMVLYPPLPTSSLPAISIVDNELPISNWPENQIYVPTKPINIIDYLSEGGTFMAEISLITELSLHAPWVGIEVCMDAKISSSVSILF